jgi:hypothetical protein
MERGRTFGGVGGWEEILPDLGLEEKGHESPIKSEKGMSNVPEKSEVRVVQVDSNLSNM